ncbi:MAG: apolipoprotein N-acyltransferase [Candidatus Cloacimonetes bacterium]|nr:apolipoprotein N-acyltransferase [Candidatus Cloacimonadota bacterium]
MRRLKAFFADYSLVMLAALLLGLTRLPIHLHFLAFICLVPLFIWFQRRQSARQAIVAGFVFSFVYTLTALHWLALTALHAEVPSSWELPMMVGIPFGLILLFGSYFALLFLLVRIAWRARENLWLVAGLWLGFEWLQSAGEFRFPWNNLGYALAPYTALLQPAEWGGVYLLSLLTFAVNALLWRAWALRRRRELLALAALLVIWPAFGVWRMHTLPLQQTGVQVGIVQASIPQEQKWDPQYEDENLAIYRDATERLAEAGTDLVIWPESAITLPLLCTDYAAGRRGQAFVTDLASEHDIRIFTGFPHFEVNTIDDPLIRYKPFLYYNACAQTSADGIEKPYSKIALVPFGERTPWLRLFPFLWKVQLGQANFEYGDGTVFYQAGNLRYSPLICFEMALPSLTRAMAIGGADAIVNISNDGWFGRSSGTWQHAQMSRYRAIETRRPVFRAANTGISMVIDPAGRVLQRAGMFEQTELITEAMTSNILTLYCRGGYLLPVVAGVVALIMTLAILIRSQVDTTA